MGQRDKLKNEQEFIRAASARASNNKTHALSTETAPRQYKQTDVDIYGEVALAIYDGAHKALQLKKNITPNLRKLTYVNNQLQGIYNFLLTKKQRGQCDASETELLEILQFLKDIVNLADTKKTFDNKRYPEIVGIIDQAVEVTMQAVTTSATHIYSRTFCKETLKATDASYGTFRYIYDLSFLGAQQDYFRHEKGIPFAFKKAHEHVKKLLTSDQVLNYLEQDKHFSLIQFFKALFAIFKSGPSSSQPQQPFLERCRVYNADFESYGSIYGGEDALKNALAEKKKRDEAKKESANTEVKPNPTISEKTPEQKAQEKLEKENFKRLLKGTCALKNFLEEKEENDAAKLKNAVEKHLNNNKNKLDIAKIFLLEEIILNIHQKSYIEMPFLPKQIEFLRSLLNVQSESKLADKLISPQASPQARRKNMSYLFQVGHTKTETTETVKPALRV